MAKNSKIFFVFPGQGSQYIGMGKSFYDQYSEARKLFDQASDILGFDLAHLCFQGSFDELSRAENVQAAVLTVSVIAFKVFQKEIGLKPDYLLGHSFGELSALVSSGMIAFADAIRIARTKGILAVRDVNNIKTAMAVVQGMAPNKLKEVCRLASQSGSEVVVGVFSSNTQMTISGHEEAVSRAENIIQQQGYQVERLRTTAPFHSPLLKKSADNLKKELKKIKIYSPKYPVISAINQKIYQGKLDFINNISLSHICPVYWKNIVNSLIKNGSKISIEIGPQKILTNLMSKINPNIKAYSFGRLTDIELFKKEFNFSKKDKLKFIIQCLKIAICLKNNNENEKEYQRKVSVPYQQVQERLLILEEEDQEPSWQDVQFAFQMLISVLENKKVSLAEKKIRLQELFGQNKNFLKLEYFQDYDKYI